MQGKPKQIRHANTRLPSSAAASTPSPGTPASGSQPAGFVPSRESVGTPALAPGVDASPLVTWGALGGTPLRLDDQDDIDLDPSDGRDGPRFRLSQTSRRDLLGREISQRATASLKRAPVPRHGPEQSAQPALLGLALAMLCSKRLLVSLFSVMHRSTECGQQTVTPVLMLRSAKHLALHRARHQTFQLSCCCTA